MLWFQQKMFTRGRVQRGGAPNWLRTQPGRPATLAVCVLTALTSTGFPTARSEPATPINPYPELRYFTRIDAEAYRLPNGQGVWFTTAHGLDCGIWFRGSFGCRGDIPGAPPGVDSIGWITGDTRVHYDWTLAIRFPPSQGALTIPPLSYIESEDSRCGSTVDGSTYCERGPWRLLISTTGTWLNG